MGILDAIPAVSAIKAYATWALLAGLAIALGVQTVRLNYSQDDLARADQTVKEQATALDLAAGINAGNVTAIHSLQAANIEWAKASAVDQASLAAADQHLAESLHTASADRKAAARALQEERHDPQCDTALSVDIGIVCPLLRQRLLDHAKNLRSH